MRTAYSREDLNKRFEWLLLAYYHQLPHKHFCYFHHEFHIAVCSLDDSGSMSFLAISIEKYLLTNYIFIVLSYILFSYLIFCINKYLPRSPWRKSVLLNNLDNNLAPKITTIRANNSLSNPLWLKFQRMLRHAF